MVCLRQPIESDYNNKHLRNEANISGENKTRKSTRRKNEVLLKKEKTITVTKKRRRN